MLRFVIVTLFSAALANVAHDGPCATVTPVSNFNLTAYQGVWYEISKLPTDAEKNGKCGSAEYKLEGDHIRVKKTHIVNGVQTSMDGTTKLAPDANNTGKLLVAFKMGDTIRESPLLILATDYNNYAIASACKVNEKKKTHDDHLWVLSRTKKLEGDAKKAVDEYLKTLKEIDTTKLVQTDFSDEACKFTSTATEAPKQ